MTNAVPIIDLSQYFVGPSQQRRLSPRHRRCLRRPIGFFKIVGHGVPQTLVDDAFATAERLLRQPAAVKDRFGGHASASARGYHALRPRTSPRLWATTILPIARAVLYRPAGQPRRRVRAHPGCGRALRGQHLAATRQPTIVPCSRPITMALETLGRSLMRIFALSLGMPETFFDDKIDRHFSTLPANHYPEPRAIRCPTRSGRASTLISAA